MSLLAFGLSNIVQQGGGKQARAGGDGVDGRLPAPCEEAIVELKSQAGHALGVREIGIESIRPKLHAPRRKYFNLPALGKSGAPDLPERIGPDHFGTVAVDALDALGENYFSPRLARIFISKNSFEFWITSPAGPARQIAYTEIIFFSRRKDPSLAVE